MVDEIINHPTLFAVFLWPYELLEKYENLLLKGRALQEMIVSGEKDYTEEIKEQLAKVFDDYGDVPYPQVVRGATLAVIMIMLWLVSLIIRG